MHFNTDSFSGPWQHLCVCVCVCVCARERQRKGKRDTGRDLCVHMCVCVFVSFCTCVRVYVKRDAKQLGLSARSVLFRRAPDTNWLSFANLVSGARLRSATSKRGTVRNEKRTVAETR